MSALRLDDQGVIAGCHRCGQRNRLPYGKLAEAGSCGKCGASLHTVAEPVDVDSEAHFQALISKSSLPVVVDFWAPWCPPCRAVAPEVAKVANETAGQYIVAKVNTEALPGLQARFQVSGIPTMAVFKNGGEVARTSGARPASQIEQFVRDAVSMRAAR